MAFLLWIGCQSAAAYQLYDPSGIYKWPQQAPGDPVTITFSFANLLDGNLGGGLHPADISLAVTSALSLWSSVAPLNFVELPDAGPPVNGAYYPAYDDLGKRYPDIRLGHRELGDTLMAVSWGPFSTAQGLYGDVHFDTTRTWAMSPAGGFDFLYTVTHELGHTLGLDHENTVPAIMKATYQPIYSGPGSEFLYPDDIAGIRALYGEGVGSVTPLYLAGDFNGDRKVEQADLFILLSCWGQTSPPDGWYGPFDGVIDQSELNDILYGWSTGMDSSAFLVAPVSAPPSVVLLAMGQGLLLVRVGRKSTRYARHCRMG